MTSIDLFSGCGGMSLGFKMAGFSSIFASDVDENAGKTFKRNFPNTPFKVKDICQITKEEVDELTGGITPDVIIGGPPCQGFSLANKRRNKIKDDPRNRLFYQFVKFIDWYSPKAFVQQNFLLKLKKTKHLIATPRRVKLLQQPNVQALLLLKKQTKLSMVALKLLKTKLQHNANQSSSLSVYSVDSHMALQCSYLQWYS